MKKVLAYIGAGAICFVLGWLANDYYTSLYSNITIKQLKNDEKANEKIIIDSINRTPIDTLRERGEQRARERFK